MFFDDRGETSDWTCLLKLPISQVKNEVGVYFKYIA